MAITIHTITRYAVQILTRREGEEARSQIIVRLYDDDNALRGTTLFQNYQGQEPPKPTGDYEKQNAMAYLDIAHYHPYVEVLRLEKPVYLKMGWVQQGNIVTLSQVSIDTKKEVIGEFFAKSSKA